MMPDETTEEWIEQCLNIFDRKVKLRKIRAIEDFVSTFLDALKNEDDVSEERLDSVKTI